MQQLYKLSHFIFNAKHISITETCKKKSLITNSMFLMSQL